MATYTYSPALTGTATGWSSGTTQLRPLRSTRPSSGPGSAPRLTRRGRVALVVVVLVAALSALIGAAGSVQAGAPGQGPAVERVVVQPGESLWQLASESMPGVDVREAVARIRELNGLSTRSMITPGQVVLVPAN